MTRSTTAKSLLLFAVAATGVVGMVAEASAQQGATSENRAIDCSQYPEDSANLYHAQFVESCRELALAMGYACTLTDSPPIANLAAQPSLELQRHSGFLSVAPVRRLGLTLHLASASRGADGSDVPEEGSLSVAPSFLLTPSIQ